MHGIPSWTSVASTCARSSSTAARRKWSAFCLDVGGIVPIVSGGVVGVKLHRPRGTSAVANVSTGVVRLKLDAFSVKAVTSDLQWQTARAAADPDRYEVRISGGAVQVSLDEDAPVLEAPHATAERQPESDRQSASALEILLDGVEVRARGHHPA